MHIAATSQALKPIVARRHPAHPAYRTGGHGWAPLFRGETHRGAQKREEAPQACVGASSSADTSGARGSLTGTIRSPPGYSQASRLPPGLHNWHYAWLLDVPYHRIYTRLGQRCFGRRIRQHIATFHLCIPRNQQGALVRHCSRAHKQNMKQMVVETHRERNPAATPAAEERCEETCDPSHSTGVGAFAQLFFLTFDTRLYTQPIVDTAGEKNHEQHESCFCRG